ncbi:MAG: class I SAM-dependent methyltransferase [Bacteroidota bacterium]
MDLSETHYSSQIRHPWELARVDVIRNLLNTAVSKPQQELNIVDVGCGDVFFLSKMQDDYPQATLFGVDVAFTGVIKSRLHAEYPDLKVELKEDIQEVPLDKTNPAHLVFLLDVIEHIDDDEDFLKQLLAQPYITEDTHIVITVPAFQKLYTSHDDILGHYRRYNIKSLLEVIDRAGLKCKLQGYFFASLALARAMEVVSEKMLRTKKQHTDVGTWDKGRGLTRMVYSILMFDFYVSRFFRILGIRLPGLSNYAICQKRV